MHSTMTAFHPLLTLAWIGFVHRYSPQLLLVASALLMHLGASPGTHMKHYRVNKLAKVGGAVIKKKDILAASDAHAVQHAAESDDCPICDVLRDGEKVGSIR